MEKKGVVKKQQLHLSKMLILTGLFLSDYLCVCGEIW